METTPITTTDKPVAFRDGRRISHYVYRDVIINRWRNEHGSRIGSTTMYFTAGTKYEVRIVWGADKHEDMTFTSLADAARFVDLRLAGEPFVHRGPANIFHAQNGNLAFHEVAR